MDGDPAAGEQPVRVEGVVTEVARTAAVVLVEDEDGRMWSVNVARPHEIILLEGSGLVPDLLPGLPIRVVGIQIGEDSIRPDTLFVLELPDLLLAQPRTRVALTMPYIPMQGHSRRGAAVQYRLLHGEDVLMEGTLQPEVFGARQYGAFQHQLQISDYDLDRPLRLEVWPASGDSEDGVSRPVHFAQERTLRLFYPNAEVDPSRLRCDNVYPVSVRSPVLTPPVEVARMLLQPPAGEQERGGFYSELAVFGGVRSAIIEGRLARVDLEVPPAGARIDSCAVVAARAQLTNTFAETFAVDSVALTVDGAQFAAGTGD